VTTSASEADYEQIGATVQALLDEIGDDEAHPLADVLDYLSGQMQAYRMRTKSQRRVPRRQRAANGRRGCRCGGRQESETAGQRLGADARIRPLPRPDKIRRLNQSLSRKAW